MKVIKHPNFYTCPECLTDLQFQITGDMKNLEYFHPVVVNAASEKCSQKNMMFLEPVETLDK